MDKWIIKDDKNIADILVEVYGRSQIDLLKNILQAFSSVLTDIKKIKNKVSLLIKIGGKNFEELVFSFVDKLIYLKDTKALLFKKGIFNFKNHHLEVKLIGQKIDQNLPIKIDIKALTYHKFKVKKTKSGYKTILVFDI